MSDEGDEFVEVPGVPKTKWGGWDSTLALPKRRVRVPITFYLSWRVIYAPLVIGILVAGTLGGLYFLYLATYRFHETTICHNRSGVAFTGLRCEIYIGVFDLLGAIITLFAFSFLVDLFQYWYHISDKTSPAIRLNGAQFAHIQLKEPIQISRTCAVSRFYYRSTLMGAALELTIEPTLRFNTVYNWRIRKAHKFAFRVSFIETAKPFSKSDLVDVFVVLSALAKQSGSPERLAPIDSAVSAPNGNNPD